MEDSKLYSTQDIEKLKEKIDSYRETLTTLKAGTSIEDYLFVKNEFEELKTQIAHIEGLTETIDDKQSLQIKEYEEQVKQLSIQIQSLNQTIEEMNQEILAVLNKIITVDNNGASTPTDTHFTNIDENSLKNIANPTKKLLEEIAQTAVQPSLTTTEPTYQFLQSLAGKATNINTGMHLPPNPNSDKKHEERHFNQHYFQSINTHPSHIYNGLYRNTTAESTFHFKNAADTQGVPVSILETNSLTAPIANDLVLTESSSLVQATVDTPTMPPATEAETFDNHDLVIEEHTPLIAKNEEASNQLEIVEKVMVEEAIEEVIEVDQKKEKNSLFFNLFRRRN